MIYILYIIIFGFFFLLKYFRSERGIKSRKELSLLVLFPMVGYGNWLYNKERRASGTTTLPRSWYIWRKMVFQNFWLTIMLTVYLGFLLGMDAYYALLADGAIKISSGAVLVFENNVDPTLATGLFLTGLTLGSIAFILIFFLVIVPAIVAKTTKFTHKERNE